MGGERRTSATSPATLLVEVGAKATERPLGPPTSTQTEVRDQASNLELAALYDADQAIRQKNMKGTPSQALLQQALMDDRSRRARVKEMVEQGQLRTGDDFFRAALILQHGKTLADYELAHTLAEQAKNLGQEGAGWLWAATYDRLCLTLIRSGSATLVGT
jgi:hypothetical protein